MVKISYNFRWFMAVDECVCVCSFVAKENEFSSIRWVFNLFNIWPFDPTFDIRALKIHSIKCISCCFYRCTFSPQHSWHGDKTVQLSIRLWAENNISRPGETARTKKTLIELENACCLLAHRQIYEHTHSHSETDLYVWYSNFEFWLCC